ncbi:DUF4129 domain-containing protein [Arthrobacter sp. CAN_C5]|uniref:DUF4129 domain-containing protein n=1 Tax=Arthrobacter sp. CAN_C5 TaxID=2760706 RepID=UPI001AE74F0C|nr:DUF4129 domain-containing protein [Arthrobacter sp. CAN_C5]MBP2215919.1 hypothetical protein [Arthrobacter sp. CAN_C5]
MPTPPVPAVLPLTGHRPVVPDDDEARRWLVDELAKGPYQEAEPNIIERLIAAILEWLGSLLAGLRPLEAGPGTLLLALGAAIVIAAAVWLVRPRLNARRKVDGVGVFAGDTVRTALEHRQLADSAASSKNWDTALTERLRAVIRSAEERGIVDSQPGRTAGETAVQLRAAFGPTAEETSWLANRFNEVHYGSQAADASDYQRATAIDDLLTATPPALQRHTPELMAPR